MSNVTIQKRGKYYQYKFEIASVDGKRKFLNKSGFKTKAEAERRNTSI
ncbi:MAG TPA: Arm DNA-binding domain-containing protein [Clostridiaceae bacterium]|nr:Arm DNA-binding domain-containing protein [Clostridiaceae bacterium]